MKPWQLGLLCLLSACGGESEVRRGSGDLSAAIQDWDTVERSPGESRVIPDDATEGEHGSTSGSPVRARTLRTHVVDVRFDDADLHNALRFLADEAGVSLVIGEGVGGTVNDRLTRVDAYRALVSLARAHGATVERQGRVVIVRGSR